MSWFGPGFVVSTLRHIPDENVRLETDLVARALRLTAQSSVVDVGCGLGRHAKILAHGGHHVTACDSDHYTIQAALHESPAPQLAFVHAAVEELHCIGDVDSAYSLMSPLGFVNDRNVDHDFLNAIRRLLHGGALFVLDYSNILHQLSRLEDSGVLDLPGGQKMMSVRQFNPLTCVAHRSRIILGPDGDELYVDEATIRLYYPHEVLVLLKAAGFEPINVCGWFDGRGFEKESPRLIIIARAQ